MRFNIASVLLLSLWSSSSAVSTLQQASFDPSLVLEDENYLSEKKVMFQSWVAKFDKEYKSGEEKMRRLLVWIQNNEMIEKHNNQIPEPSFTMDHNQFSDMTWDEFQEYNKLGPYSPGMVKMNDQMKVVAQDDIEDHRSLLLSDDDDVPEEWNWVDNGAVPPVKNQGMCGSCWAFSAIGAIEGARYVDTGNLTPLSEQELVDCDKMDFGCGGGLMDNAFLFDEDSTGICSEEDYPYIARKHRIFSCHVNKNDGEKHLFPRHPCDPIEHSRVKTFVDIEPTLDALVKAISKQPVSVAIQADLPSFQFYKQGVYADASCGNQLDHGVVAVGYGVEEEVPYFLVRNSWGGNWGDEGYIKMARVDTATNGTCGILQAASVPILRDDDDN